MLEALDAHSAPARLPRDEPESARTAVTAYRRPDAASPRRWP
jgi:hypothetical protein